MQLLQLTTFVGLVLSYARAAPSAIESQIELVQQIVTLATRPDIVVQNTPALKSLQDLVSQSPAVFDHQFHRGAVEVLTSLRSVGGDHTPYIAQSMVGYHNTLDPRRLAIYRDSMYSRLVDLAHDNPETALDHLQSAKERLMSYLEIEVSHLKEQHVAPMGDKKVIEKLEKLFTEFKQENKVQIEQYKKKILSMLPSNRESTPMHYLTRNQVNVALQETNTPGHPPAMLIDGFKALYDSMKKTHAPTHRAIPKAPAPETHSVAAAA